MANYSASRAVVLFDFTAREDNEIDLEEGQILNNVEQLHAGMGFPSSFAAFLLTLF